MDFKSKASITLTGSMAAAQIVDAVRNLPGFEAAVLDAAQAAAEAAKSSFGLSLATRGLTINDAGSAVVELVFEKVDAPPASDAGQGTPEAGPEQAQDGATPPVVSLTLQPQGSPPAVA